MNNNFKSVKLIFIFLMLISLPLLGNTAEDIDTLGQRILQPFRTDINTSVVRELMNSLEEDGSWPSIDYTDETTSSWETIEHIYNLKTLVKGYISEKSDLYGNQELKNKIMSSLNYWLENNFKNPNWWWNEIGVPLNFGPLLIALKDELSDWQKDIGENILARADLSSSGTNLIWRAQINIYRGVFISDPVPIDSAFQKMKDEIVLSDEEGIQYDFSFHQHGNLLYNHGYGGNFVNNCIDFIELARGTQFNFSSQKIELLVDFILKGTRWMTFGQSEDYGADGREITRPDQNSKYLIGIIDKFLEYNISFDKAENLKIIRDRIQEDIAQSFIGNKHFWMSDFMTHHRKNYYTSTRMYSTRTVNTDWPSNGEGLLNHYIADGCNFIFVDGDEYINIFPVWDWQKIPGTTVEQTGEFEDIPRREGNTDFVGGVSNGKYGASTFYLKRNTLEARKSWFFFDKQYVCLGTGIQSESSNKVYTTINQSYLNGDVLIGKENQQNLGKGSHTLESPVNIYHDNINYHIKSDNNLILKNQSQTGSWQQINEAKSSEEISKEVFTLSINHGANNNNAQYYYVVYPATNNNYLNNSNVEEETNVLKQNQDIQAVKNIPLSLTQIVFYNSGEVKISDTTTVSTNSPCLLMLEEKTNSISITASDPTQNLNKIELNISGCFEGEGCTYQENQGNTNIDIYLPAGNESGKSITKVIDRVKPPKLEIDVLD